MNNTITFADKNLDLSHIFPRFYKKINDEKVEDIKEILNEILLYKFNNIYPNLSFYLDKNNNIDQLKKITVMASSAQSQDKFLEEIKSKFPLNR